MLLLALVEAELTLKILSGVSRWFYRLRQPTSPRSHGESVSAESDVAGWDSQVIEVA